MKPRKGSKVVRWRFLREIAVHELHSGAIRLTDHRIAKVPWDFHQRIDLAGPIHRALFDLYLKRGKRTVGVRETLKIIRVHEVTRALR